MGQAEDQPVPFAFFGGSTSAFPCRRISFLLVEWLAANSAGRAMILRRGGWFPIGVSRCGVFLPADQNSFLLETGKLEAGL